VTDIARGELAKGNRTFGELWAAVEKQGGSKFALKSALGKGRERGEFHFNGEHYSAKSFTKAPPKKKALSPKTKGQTPIGASATS
jgi:hypothetical protein